MNSTNTSTDSEPQSSFISWVHASVSAVLLVFVVTSLCGLPRLQFDDDLKNLFKGESKEYVEFEKFSQQFGSTDGQCVILLTCPNVLEKGTLKKIRRIDTACENMPEFKQVISLCGLLEAKRVGRMFFSAIPFEESKESEWDAAHAILARHPLGSGVQFSQDRKHTLIAVELNSTIEPDEVADVHRKLEEVLNREWVQNEPESFKYGMTGLPIIRNEITSSLQRDQRKFTLLGLLFSVVIGWGLFRKPIPVLLLAVIPFTGLGCIMGILGWLNVPLNIVNNVVTPLVLVIGFAEVIHILFMTGGLIGSGLGHREAVVVMVKQLFLPCLLAALTTAIGFGSLFLAEDKSLKDFAIVASVSSLIMFAIVLAASSCLLATPLARFCVRAPKETTAHENHSARERGRIPATLPFGVSLLAIGVVVIFGYVAMRNHFDYRYTENLPESNKAVTTLRKMDEAFGGSSPNHVVVEFEDQPQLGDLFGLLRSVQAKLEAIDSVDKTVSFMDFLDSMPPISGSDLERFRELRYLPKEAWESLLKVNPTVANIHVSLPDSGSHALLPVMDQISEELENVSSDFPNAKATLTGLNVLTVKRSQKMINDLVNSLLGASMVIFGLILIVYRSFVFAVAAIIVNAFPILGVAAAMCIAGQPIQYTGIMLLCTCLGLAVDDTVHFLSKTKIQIQDGVAFERAVFQTAKKLWPVLLTTSLMLGVGFGLAATSDIPTFQTFGGYACLALALALVGDLLFLPFLLIVFHRCYSSIFASSDRQKKG